MAGVVILSKKKAGVLYKDESKRQSVTPARPLTRQQRKKKDSFLVMYISYSIPLNSTKKSKTPKYIVHNDGGTQAPPPPIAPPPRSRRRRRDNRRRRRRRRPGTGIVHVVVRHHVRRRLRVLSAIVSSGLWLCRWDVLLLGRDGVRRRRFRIRRHRHRPPDDLPRGDDDDVRGDRRLLLLLLARRPDGSGGSR